MLEMTEEEFDFSGVPNDAVGEFYRQAELYLDNLLKIGLAADARASTSSSIFAAAAAGLFAVSANTANTDHPHIALVFSLFSAAIFLAVASGICAFAARPRPYFHPGHTPDLLFAISTSETNIKRKMAEKLQGRIEKNQASLKRDAGILRLGQNFAGLSIVAAGSTFFWLYHLS